MYQKFTVDKFILRPASDELVLTFTLDIDEDTVDDSSIYITKTKAGMQPLLMNAGIEKFSTDGQIVTMKYHDFDVNEPYEVHVTHKVRSIMDDPLEVEFVKQFVIPSEVDSKVVILSPAEYEAAESLSLKVKEVEGKSKKLWNTFQVQVSDDVNFLNLILDSEIDDKTEAVFEDLKPASQYFLRVRSIHEKEHGNWSEPRTFTISQKKVTPENQGAKPEPKPDDDLPLVYSDLELVAAPENGMTPQSFLFEFDTDLDEESLKKSGIIVTMREV